MRSDSDKVKRRRSLLSSRGVAALVFTLASETLAPDAKGQDAGAADAGVETSIPCSAVPRDLGEHRDLMIVHPAVVDPYLNGGRSHNGGPGTVGGPWSFRTLMTDLMRSTADEHPSQGRIDDFMSAFLEPWLEGYALTGGVQLPPRPKATLLLDQFSTTTVEGRTFELWKAPFELIAIVPRLDLRSETADHAGELRFVYEMTPAGSSQFTLIVEYHIPVEEWTAARFAREWSELGQLSITSAEYLDRLEYITNRVTKWTPQSPSRAPRLAHVRTNEIAFAATPAGPWDLREFRMSGGLLLPALTENTPVGSLNGTATLASFIEQARQQLDPEQLPNQPPPDPLAFLNVVMPEAFDGEAFLGGQVSAGGPEFDWVAPGLDANDIALDNFGLLTCNGCHQQNQPTGAFYHVAPDKEPCANGVSRLSGFVLDGDSEKGPRRPPELNRRAVDFDALVLQCTGSCIAGNECAEDSDCATGTYCVDGYCGAPLHCHNWGFNLVQGETDLDCGGPCGPCAEGASCATNDDCASPSECSEGVCAIPTCSDGYANGGESDVDCGGPSCARCAKGQHCVQARDEQVSDCATAHCGSEGLCAEPEECHNGCWDAALESGLDCGKQCDRKCGVTGSCSTHADCHLGFCLTALGICVDPMETLCADEEPNPGWDTDVDCGGVCPPCSRGKSCLQDRDCQGERCASGTCEVPSQCDNGTRDNGSAGSQEETWLNCGGPCDDCPIGSFCHPEVPGCAHSSVCASFQCTVPDDFCARNSVADSALGETDVDCGTPECGGCLLNKQCTTDANCQVGLKCTSGLCKKPAACQ